MNALVRQPPLGLKVFQPALGVTGLATANVAAIQSLLDLGGPVYLIGYGVAYINTPLTIGSNTKLILDPRLTIKQTSGNNENLLQSKCYTRAWTTITSITWSSATPMVATINIGGGFTAAQGDFIVIKGTVGTTSPAFTGVFRVIDASTPSAPVVALRHIPAASPSGTIQAKLADVNVWIEGGTWDYDQANNAGATGADNHAIVLFGVANSGYRDITIRNSKKFGICLAAINKFKGLGLDYSGVSDAVKVYGPAFDSEFDGVLSDGNDDVVSFHTQETTAFSAYDISGGDLIGLKASNVSVARGFSVCLYATHGWWWCDDIVFSGISGHGANTSETVKPLIRVAAPLSTDSYPASAIGFLHIDNVEINDQFGGSNNILFDTTDSGTYTINDVLLTRITVGKTNVNVGGYAINFAMSTACVMNKITIRDSVFRLIGSNSLNGVGFQTGPTYGNVDFSDCHFIGDSDLAGAAAFFAATSLNQMTFSRCRFDVIKYGVDQTGVTTTTPKYVFRDCHFNGNVALGLLAGATVSCHLSGNKFLDCGLGVISPRVASAVINVSSGGGNVFPAGSLFTVASGGTVGFVGNCADLKFDLSATGVNRSDGAIVYNTNAALGTLGAAGLVCGQGTAANSWHLMSDPTKVY